MSNERLKSFCEGLEMNFIDELLTGDASDFKRVGEVMYIAIKDQKAIIDELAAALKDACGAILENDACCKTCEECHVYIALEKVES